ncbi:MAG: hypothetical protein R3F61_33130 [Myxococcota bacterium]
MPVTLFALVLGGCVAKGRYELSQVQLEATRAALDAREVDARESLDEARVREESLRAEIAELQAQTESQRGHLEELEAELGRASVALAEHVVLDRTQCPPLPEAVPCVDPDVPPDPTAPAPEPESPEVVQRREHVKASLEDVSEALLLRSRMQWEMRERDARHTRVVEAFQPLIQDGLAAVDRRGDDTIVRILVAKLYTENKTTLSPLGLSIVGRLKPILESLPDHDLVVVGHTDDVANYSATLPSNWELGFAYAVGVLRTLQDDGVSMKMSAGSRAGMSPVVDPVDAEARRLNRRVELILKPRVFDPPPAEDEAPETPETPEDGAPE